MKRLLTLLLIIIFALSGCAVSPKHTETEEAGVNAVWIFYSELSMVNENGGSEKSFTKKMETMLDNCLKWGINTVFIQVRPCCDSFYESEIFPWSYYLTGQQGKAVDYDPLEITAQLAHERGIAVHAWLNPFRIAFDSDTAKLAKNHPALDWIENKTADVVFVNNGIYFSPASISAQKLVIDGVREIIKNYDVDGIHIDDYFYPSTDKSVDEYYFKQYTEGGGKLSLDDWRLNTVSAFVAQLYTAVKSENSDCIFSISPAGNINNNYEQHYADVRLWCSQRGYADWIIPQLYYGFENDTLPFDKALKEWSKLDKIGAVKMIYGLAAYKVNDSDDEWLAGRGMIDKQLELVKETDNSYGVAYFSYSSLADKKRSAEFENISTFLTQQASTAAS